VEFGTLIWIIMLIVAPLATALFAGSWGLIDEIGKGGLTLEDPLPPPPAPSRPMTAMAKAEQEAEIRQMVQARHDRELARGETPVEVDVEVDRLLAMGAEMEHDPSSEHDELLREEVRQLVVARNERRMKHGEPPLDVEEEVQRQLKDLGA
jgi:hypothetical protein